MDVHILIQILSMPTLYGEGRFVLRDYKHWCQNDEGSHRLRYTGVPTKLSLPNAIEFHVLRLIVYIVRKHVS